MLGMGLEVTEHGGVGIWIWTETQSLSCLNLYPALLSLTQICALHPAFPAVWTLHFLSEAGEGFGWKRLQGGWAGVL